MLDGIDVYVRVSPLNLSWRVLLFKLLCTPPTEPNALFLKSQAARSVVDDLFYDFLLRTWVHGASRQYWTVHRSRSRHAQTGEGKDHDADG